jgi:hypothetical protein
MNFSEKWIADGHGLWCHGVISRVYVKKGRQPQKYSIKYDEGSTMASLEADIEAAEDEDSDSEPDIQEKERDEVYSSDRDSGNQSKDSDDEDNYQRSKEQEKEEDDTDEDTGEAKEGGEDCEEDPDGNVVKMGETVVCGDDEDPKRLTWTRVQDILEDQRTANKEDIFFKNLRMNDRMMEMDIFLALMPVQPETLLAIVRAGSEKANCRLTWTLDHIMAALCIIFRAIQGRCTSCRIRKKNRASKGRAPNTAWGCACHQGEYFCRNKTCWSEHLQTVRATEEESFAI